MAVGMDGFDRLLEKLQPHLAEFQTQAWRPGHRVCLHFCETYRLIFRHVSFASEKLIDNPNSSRVSNTEIQEPFMIISATLHTLFSADAEGHFGFYYFMRKSGSLRA